MKKIYLVLPVVFASLALGISFASATENSFATNSEGETLPLLVISTETGVDAYNHVIKDGDDNRGSSTVKTVRATTTLRIEDDEKSEGNRNASSSFDKDEDANFELDGAVERSNDSRGLLISHMAQVHSGLELKAFVQSLVHENKDIQDVVTKEDSVLVTRTIPTKLFWFIPMSATETVEVMSFGNGAKQVAVNRSWWNVFAKDEVAKDTISSDIDSRMNMMPMGAFTTVLDPATKARIIAEIQAVFIANGYATSTVAQ